MPQLVKGGPDLPPKLLQAQEEGKLVLFCGAGVSKQAGLPLFGELVDEVYKELGVEPEPVEARLLNRGAYDQVLDLLEKRQVTVRDIVRNRLTPLDIPDLPVHRALLELTEIEGGHRLVTTNFDRLFLQAGFALKVEAAPRLPVPRPHRWRSVVHLHGLIDGEDPKLQDLILTSSDFGRAYLVDGWAARFVTELFRSFTVLFVGYAVDDPVMRYLTDAIAGERTHGSQFNEPFAFAGIASGPKKAREEVDDWRAKGVRALTYSVGRNRDHRVLRETLLHWAALRRQGFQGRKALALKHADTKPPSWLAEEARQVVWALSEPSGRIAKAFAEYEPCPPIEWLEIFESSEELPEGAKLLAMPVCEADGTEARLIQPLIRPPGEYNPVDRISPITWALGSWLARHLGQRKLVEWVVGRGSKLGSPFREQIRRRLREDVGLAPAYRRLWEILSSETYAARRQAPSSLEYCDLIERLSGGEWSPFLRMETLRLLTPRLYFRDAQPLRWLLRESDGATEPETPADLATIEVRLAGQYDGEEVARFLVSGSAPKRSEILADLGLPLAVLLREAQDLSGLAGDPEAAESGGVWAMPSIEPHEQNRHYRQWSWLVDILRECLLTLDREEPSKAEILVAQWRSEASPLFLRLTLFAATRCQSVDPMVGFHVLVDNDCAALWWPATMRECMQFLALRSRYLPQDACKSLIDAILAGPPEPIATRIGSELCERAIYVRLQRHAQGLDAPPTGVTERMEQIVARLGLPPEMVEKDEFAVWMGSLVDLPDAPISEATLEELLGAAGILGLSPEERERHLVTWRKIVAEAPARALSLLQRIGASGEWPGDFWRYALSSRAEVFALDEVAPLLLRAPHEFLSREIAAITNWLENQAGKAPTADGGTIFQLVKLLLPLSAVKQVHGLSEDPVGVAINHPIGRLANIAVIRLSALTPPRGSGLPQGLRWLFDRLGRGESDVGSVARVIFCSQLRFLHAVDSEWVEEVLIPRLEWANAEAPILWKAFLWQPRASPDLLVTLRGPLLEVYSRLDQFESLERRAVRFLTLASLELPEALPLSEVRPILRNLSADLLAEVAEALADSLRRSGEKAGIAWRERIGPWFDGHWPRKRLQSPEVSIALTELIIAADEEMPAALSVVESFLTPIGKYSIVVGRIEKAALAQRFPAQVLEILRLVVPDHFAPDAWYGLGAVLDQIEAADGALAHTLQFRRLRDLVARAQS